MTPPTEDQGFSKTSSLIQETPRQHGARHFINVFLETNLLQSTPDDYEFSKSMSNLILNHICRPRIKGSGNLETSTSSVPK